MPEHLTPFTFNIFENGIILKGGAFLFLYVLVMLTIIVIAGKWINRKSYLHSSLFQITIYTSLLFSGLGMMGLLIGIIIPIASIISISESIQIRLIEMFSQKGIFTFTYLVIAAPILEEILFRGIILKEFLKKQSTWKAIIFSSILFGLFHLNPVQVISSFIGGLFIGWILVKMKSLIYPIFLHLIVNLVFYLAIHFMPLSKLMNINILDLYGGTPKTIIIITIGLLLLSYSTYFIQESDISQKNKAIPSDK